MLVLVTRPRSQSLVTARALHAMGHRVIIDPMLLIRSVPHEPLASEGVAAILLTSRHGATGLDERFRHLPIFAVGRATAAAARSRGFADVRTGPGDGAALARLVSEQLAPGDGTILHVCGEETRPELAQALREAGYSYQRSVVYRADAAGTLSSRTVGALREGTLGAALFFSPRTAGTFRDLLEQASLDRAVSPVTAVCLSETIADELRGLGWRDIRIAVERDQAAVLACLEAAAEEC
ncbi:uroporphyrinogen-III synthase [Marinimicrococcus flavescens]|uniref:Uroporphyrinogen-III synthase n=1 Tax=Marinimicrococcus flavescens TaxID=3031815 RepID=A0AAP3XRD7_9PROT|nr:uroporphyrinogen-III synthase [Marinimicrococcus flavescens]